MRLLAGEVETPEQARIADLENEVESLKDALASAQADTQRERRQTDRAVGELRRQLTPLYRAMQGLFGELDQFSEGDTPTAPVDSRTKSVWDAWKKRLSGKPAELIDALLLHGEMSGAQIAIAIQCHKNSVPQIVYKLNKAGLLNKNGGKYSLKQL